ncbi:MAG: hypothetical protein M0R40_00595 [Firmicutes bacterium]|nr:hypothetical protein [Bacillota bacterium]
MNPSEIEQTVLYNLKNNITAPPDYRRADLMLYLSLYNIYSMVKNHFITREQGSVFKRKVIEDHRQLSFWEKYASENGARYSEANRLFSEKPVLDLETAIKIIEVFYGGAKFKKEWYERCLGKSAE